MIPETIAWELPILASKCYNSCGFCRNGQATGFSMFQRLIQVTVTWISLGFVTLVCLIAGERPLMYCTSNGQYDQFPGWGRLMLTWAKFGFSIRTLVRPPEDGRQMQSVLHHAIREVEISDSPLALELSKIAKDMGITAYISAIHLPNQVPSTESLAVKFKDWVGGLSRPLNGEGLPVSFGEFTDVGSYRENRQGGWRFGIWGLPVQFLGKI
jgi:hypothetical protein